MENKGFFDTYNQIEEFRRKNAEYRNRILKYWKRSDKELNKIQGTYRSNAYKMLSIFSQSQTPMNSQFYDKLINELTENERKLLEHKKNKQ